ncbi:MAG TPA: TIGR00270 family protein [Methanoculleus sp.]|nr:TIGR00270 family protein [Methanoculleus sp.]
MQCELCGAKIRGAPKIVRIEGAELRVCSQCARLGTEVHRPPARPGAHRKTPGAPAAPQRRRPRDVFDLMEGEIVDDYSDRIRTSRMQKGWTQKDLAMRIKEKELLVKKFEKGDLIPEDVVRKKLEQVLGVSLLDTASDDLAADTGGTLTTTFGDLIKIKKGDR